MWRYFSVDETACRCGCGRNEMSREFMRQLEHAREIAGVPFVLTSAFRCIKHNAAVGGVPTSDHTSGEGVDIAWQNARELYCILKGLFDAGITRVFIYPYTDPPIIHAGIAFHNPQEVCNVRD